MARRYLKRRHLDWLKDRVNHSGVGCLIWPFGKNQKGYGQVCTGPGKIEKAHRVMCQLVHGEPPTPKHQAGHKCGNGHLACVHPGHLRWQTNSQNQLDRRRHGTSQGHIGKGPHRLTKEAREQIMAARGRITTLKLAEQHGVSHGTIDYWHKKARIAALIRG